MPRGERRRVVQRRVTGHEAVQKAHAVDEAGHWPGQGDGDWPFNEPNQSALPVTHGQWKATELPFDEDSLLVVSIQRNFVPPVTDIHISFYHGLLSRPSFELGAGVRRPHVMIVVVAGGLSIGATTLTAFGDDLARGHVGMILPLSTPIDATGTTGTADALIHVFPSFSNQIFDLA